MYTANKVKVMVMWSTFPSAPLRLLGRLARLGEPASSHGVGPSEFSTADEDLVHLIYELMDAHSDTAQIVGHSSDEPEWETHLAYLRGLQRAGRAALARLPVGES
jgi:hypothetical protein